jgi:hypothetical protein
MARPVRGSVWSRVLAVGGVLAAASLAGCREPTEVVVVVDTDLQQFVDFDSITFSLVSTFGGQAGQVASGRTIPATLGLVPAEDGRQTFDLTVSAVRDTFMFQEPPVVSRRVSNVTFVSGEMRTLFVTLLRFCKCEGTSCPNALEDDCRDVTNPVLTEFDEDNLPRLQAQAP